MRNEIYSLGLGAAALLLRPGLPRSGRQIGGQTRSSKLGKGRI